MDTLYREIKWKSESKKRRLTTSMVFVNFNDKVHSVKEIYDMPEDQQDPYYATVTKRVKTLFSD
jgi:alkyl hydroperoxide reductase subunit AhpC